MYVMDAGNNVFYSNTFVYQLLFSCRYDLYRRDVIHEQLYRIQQWASGSTFGVTIVSASMSNPRGMSFDPNGNLAVADYSNHRVILFSAVCRK